MENERLRRAMVRASVTLEDVHRVTGVDEKTVQRWLRGRVPHQRHRWAVAKLVTEDEAYLWPSSEARVDSGAGSTAEVVATYAHRADAPNALWTRLIDDARQAVDVLGYAVQFLPELYPALATRLVAKAGTDAVCASPSQIRTALKSLLVTPRRSLAAASRRASGPRCDTSTHAFAPTSPRSVCIAPPCTTRSSASTTSCCTPPISSDVLVTSPRSSTSGA